MNADMAVTVKDIADVLQISPATVSLAINNRRGVSEKTRERVFEVAREMGYAKTTAAARVSAHTIQCVIFKQRATAGLDTSFFSKMMEGVESRAGQNGGALMLTYVNAEENMTQRLETICAGATQGIILLATELTPESITPFLSIRLPMVVLDAYFENLPLDCVTINNAQGAYMATSYLAQQGHTEIGYLTSKVRTVNFSERHEGFRKAFRHHKLVKKAEYSFRLTPSIEGACADMKAALQQHPNLPTAFFADNDVIAAGAMRAFKEMGVRVPEDVSVVGFDDIPLCSSLDPPLTTVGVPKERLGSLAMDRLYSKIEQAAREPGPQAACEVDQHTASEFVKIEVGTTLVERASVRSLL